MRGLFWITEQEIKSWKNFLARITLRRWPISYRFLHLLLQVDQAKAEQDNDGESLEDDDINETKAAKENTSKIYVCNICGNSFM